MEWIRVNGIKEVPEGSWLVELEREYGFGFIHSAEVGGTFSIIGGHFAFDCPTVIAYMPLPKSVNEQSD